MRNLSERLRRLEVAEQGEGRVIVAAWPDGGAEAAMAAKGISPRRDDLLINLAKPAGQWAGWVSINGQRI